MINKKKLKAQILLAGYKSNKEFSEKLGMTENNFCNKVNGKTNTSIEEAKNWSNILGLNDKEFLDTFFDKSLN